MKISLVVGLGALFALTRAVVAHAPAMVLEDRQRAWGTHIQAGDILFQDLDCGLRCNLIRDVTASRYTHVGIVLLEGDKLRVWEAFAPVGPTRTSSNG